MEGKTFWEIRSYNQSAAEQLSQELNISPLLARLLTQRGVLDPGGGKRFLFGTLEDLSDPLELSGMNTAVLRIEKAIAAGERVVIYGDYDVDGICSTVLLVECFQALGLKVEYYVPDRFQEGYGLSIEAIKQLVARKCSLLITVDCGISSVEEISQAMQMGMDVIVTDHHTPPVDLLPPAIALINPKLDSNQECINLAGAGVAFKLALALIRDKAEIQFMEWLELAAIATVADIVPVLGENRILVKYGMAQLQNTTRLGLKALLAQSGLEGKQLAPWHISFILAPRLNSAGRLNTAETSIELLLTRDPERAAQLAALLCKMNNDRKTLEENIFKQAVLQVQTQANLQEENILVVAGEGWHQGVIGIVASRLCERYNRPAIVISWQDDTGKGSGRSTAGVNLYEALDNCRQHLVRFGGHTMAAGLSIERASFEPFKSEMNRYAAQQSCMPDYRKYIVDMELDEDKIGSHLIKELEMLQPYGEGNPCPNFVWRQVEIDSAIAVGKKGEHFKAKINPGGWDSIAFNQAEWLKLPLKQCFFDLVLEVEENNFRGKNDVQLKIKDIKFSMDPGGWSSNNHNGKRIFDICCRTGNELAQNRPVIFIYPTYRVLKQYQPLMKHLFRPQVIEVLHGKLSPEQRRGAGEKLKRGLNQLFLVSQPYLEYFVKGNSLPQDLRYTVKVCPDGQEGLEAEYLSHYQVDFLNDPMGKLKWKKHDWQYNNSRHTIIYAHRNKTVKSLANRIPNPTIECGIRDYKKRQELRRQFVQDDAGVLLSDGVYIDGVKQPEQAELVFADFPFSYYEAITVMEQIAATKDEAVALFDAGDLTACKRYLSRIYPPIDKVKKVLNYFKKQNQNPLRADMTLLSRGIEAYTGHDFKSFDLVPILCIMVDLGLCHIKKNGSIIEIIFVGTKKVVDIADSPYHLEGLAEKKAFSSWEREVVQSLVW